MTVSKIALTIIKNENDVNMSHIRYQLMVISINNYIFILYLLYLLLVIKYYFLIIIFLK